MADGFDNETKSSTSSGSLSCCSILITIIFTILYFVYKDEYNCPDDNPFGVWWPVMISILILAPVLNIVAAASSKCKTNVGGTKASPISACAGLLSLLLALFALIWVILGTIWFAHDNQEGCVSFYPPFTRFTSLNSNNFNFYFPNRLETTSKG